MQSNTTKNYARNNVILMHNLNQEAVNFIHRSYGEREFISQALRRANAGNTVEMLTTFAQKTMEFSKNEDSVKGAKLLMERLVADAGVKVATATA